MAFLEWVGIFSRLHIINSYPFSSCEVQFWKAVNPKGNLKNEVELERESDRKKKSNASKVCGGKTIM